MGRIAFALSLALAFGASQLASAQNPLVIDCSGGCTVTTYGLSAPDSYGKEPDPIFERNFPLLTPLARDFDGSYAFQKDVTGPADPRCDGEGGFVPVFGRVNLRDQTNCVPTDTVGCPVEVAIDLNPPATVPSSPTETWFADSRLIFVNAQLGPGFFVQMTISTASHGRIHGFGTRFRTGAGPATHIRWTRLGTDSRLGKPNDPSDDFTRGDSRSKVCCNFTGGFNLCGASGLDTYPVITDTQALGSVLKNIPNWNFVGGRGTDFDTDGSLVVPGQLHGVCSGKTPGLTDAQSRQRRRVGCDVDACVSRGMVCNATTSTCGGVTGGGAIACTPNLDECNNPGATCNLVTGFCNTGAGQHITDDIPCDTDADCRLNDVCDLSEGGYRLQRSSTTPPPTSETTAVGSCANNTAIQCTQGNCTPATNPACECVAAGGGECSLARTPIPTVCGEALFNFRGKAQSNCSILGSFLSFSQCEALATAGQEPGCIVTPGTVGRRRGFCGTRPNGSPAGTPFTLHPSNTACELDGDPGSDCMGRNYGAFIRPDQNCDGVDDVPVDKCPMYNETDPFSDKDGDGRGDECQCGDAQTPTRTFVNNRLVRTRNGFVTVADLVATNLLIFNDPASGTGADGRYRISAPLCDSTGDDRCNVSDIVGTNLEIFSPGFTARCFRYPCPEPLTSCTSTGAPLP